MTELALYAGLFLSAFLAATVLPLQSEAAVVGLLIANYPPWLVITVASAGNILGSMINWLLGRGIDRLRHRPWFPADENALAKAQRWYHRYGRWSLLMSWMPVIGDPITVVAGVLREPLREFLLLVAVAKIGRYIVLAALTLPFL